MKNRKIRQNLKQTEQRKFVAQFSPPGLRLGDFQSRLWFHYDQEEIITTITTSLKDERIYTLDEI